MRENERETDRQAERERERERYCCQPKGADCIVTIDASDRIVYVFPYVIVRGAIHGSSKHLLTHILNPQLSGIRKCL